jgi:glycosyltransferase involved in cell wall biosynthesis
MGMQMRDFSLITEIVKSQPSVRFIICSALLEIKNHFEGCNNVTIKGFMPEDNLRDEMDKADVSLNLMIDTVGSNVITTSMAMGLINIVSNVGSISDYCSPSNSFFCNTTQDFSKAIDVLNKNRKLLQTMKTASLEHSKLFSFENFNKMIIGLK